MEKWIDFFEPFFPSRHDATEFIKPIESLAPGDLRHAAKVMLHQTQRLISIADELPTIRPGKESLQLAFLLICAENIAKLHADFDGEGSSKAYVRRFFGKFVVNGDLSVFHASFTTHERRRLDLQTVVDALYTVRCDVVHEGRYWGFHFGDGETQMVNIDPDVVVSITLRQFRDIIVRGCILAIDTYPGRAAP